MQAIEIALAPLAFLLTTLLVLLWCRAFFFLEFDRWLSALRLLAAGAVIAGLTTSLVAPSAWALPLGVCGLACGSAFLVVQTFSRQPRRRANVALGSPIPEFAAIDGCGVLFHSRELAGEHYLLKFYRGHWCPYCRRELRAWHALGSQLAARRIRFVAISPDTPEEVEKFARSHPHYVMRLLSDESLRVTDLFHLRSHATLAVGLGRSVRRPLAIPTTILVDARGVARWIDQSDDHQVRSDPKRVLPAIDRALGWTEARASTAVSSFEPTSQPRLPSPS